MTIPEDTEFTFGSPELGDGISAARAQQSPQQSPFMASAPIDFANPAREGNLGPHTSRLYRRSMAYSANSERASVVTIARTPSTSHFRTTQGEDADAMERGAAPRSEPDPDHREDGIREQDDSVSELEEPLLVQAHRVNHDTAPEDNSDSLDRRVTFAMNISLAANILLLVAKVYAWWFSQSKAILASAADSVVDIGSQLVIAVAEHKVHTADPRFPIGRTRLETVGVVGCAVIMTLSTIEVIQSAAWDLYSGYFRGQLPELDMSAMMYVILGAATGIKALLWVYCVALRNQSDSMMALAEDHRNDIMSNLTAIACGVIGSQSDRLWFVDPWGAILISAYIICSWGLICMNQVDKIVGKGAPMEFIEKLEELANSHHQQLEVDVLRAYHFGSKFICEVEVVMPADMTVKESHDIALILQHKVEGFDEVERAFVHVDYARREEPEHKVERNLLNKSSNIFESFESNHGSLEHGLSGNISAHGSSGSAGLLMAPKDSKTLKAGTDEPAQD